MGGHFYSELLFFDTCNELLQIKYKTVFIALFKKEYKFENDWKLIAIADANQALMYSLPIEE
jgi:hypothetical protein